MKKEQNKEAISKLVIESLDVKRCTEDGKRVYFSRHYWYDLPNIRTAVDIITRNTEKWKALYEVWLFFEDGRAVCLDDATEENINIATMTAGELAEVIEDKKSSRKWSWKEELA